jgi:hypothetical protein
MPDDIRPGYLAAPAFLLGVYSFRRPAPRSQGFEVRAFLSYLDTGETEKFPWGERGTAGERWKEFRSGKGRFISYVN